MYLYKKRKNMFVIIKYVKGETGIKVPVILLNGQSEIWEFETHEEAEKMKTIFDQNSDSGHKYEVKKI
jgi:glutaredoxin